MKLQQQLMQYMNGTGGAYILYESNPAVSYPQTQQVTLYSGKYYYTVMYYCMISILYTIDVLLSHHSIRYCIHSYLSLLLHEYYQ